MSDYAYPSSVVEVTVNSQCGDESARHVIRIPSREQFRLDKILVHEEYSLPAVAAPPRVVLDVGANVGLFALYIKLRYPQAVIYCYEPVPATVALLRHNIGRLSGVNISPCALGRGEGETEIHLHRINTGQNSVDRIEGDSAYRGTVRIPQRDAGHEFDALSEQRIDVLKIDTEGCELEILESLGDRLDKIDYVLAEYHSDEDRRRIDALLEHFSLYGAVGVTRNRGTVKYVHHRACGNDVACPREHGGRETRQVTPAVN